MSFSSVIWAFKQIAPAKEKLVLLVIANHTGQDGSCFPSMGTIARECGLSRRSVIRAIDNLKKLGLLSVEARFQENGKGKRSHVYRLQEAPKHNLRVVTGSHKGGDTESLGW